METRYKAFVAEINIVIVIIIVIIIIIIDINLILILLVILNICYLLKIKFINKGSIYFPKYYLKALRYPYNNFSIIIIIYLFYRFKQIYQVTF